MIELENVQYARGEFDLKIEHLRLDRGLTVLVGRNGAGKSTLIQLLATAEWPDRGRIQFGQSTTNEALARIRSQIGYVPTGLELYEEHTVQKLLQYFAELKGVDREKEVERVVSELGLGSVKHLRIRQLSQGGKQKVAIAQALLGEPYLLLLDEPLNYLDSRERKELIQWMTRYAMRHMVLVATHELNEWSSQMDTILWLDRGKVGFYGHPDEWVQDVTGQVWSGNVEVSRLAELNEDRLIQVIPGDQYAKVRMMGGVTPPHVNFTEEPLTVEDAYFLRVNKRRAPY